MLAPVDRFGGSTGRLTTLAGAVALATVVGGVVGVAASSFAAGIATFVAVCTTLGCALAVWAATRFREDAMALLKAPTSSVRFDEPRIVQVQGAAVVVVPVVNEPLGARADGLHATARVESLDGEVIVEGLPIKWQATEQAAVTLAANGLPRNLNIGFACDDERHAVLADRYEIEERDFLVWVSVTGSNVPRLTTVVRVQRDGSALSLVPLDPRVAG